MKLLAPKPLLLTTPLVFGILLLSYIPVHIQNSIANGASRLNLFLFWGLGTICYTIAITGIVQAKKESDRKSNHQTTDDKTYKNREAELLYNYIEEHYHDLSLTKEQVIGALSLSSYQINEILKDRYNMTYKQYLNHIRMKEAERLLKETNRQISDIARTVGYFYPNSFTRTFINLKNISPSEYRKECHRQCKAI